MNHNLKLAVTAAIAALGMTSQAQAVVNSTAGTGGSLFLYVFEDRQANPLATNSAMFDLGLAPAFDTTSNQTIDLSANSAWTTYIAPIANRANIHWGVIGSVFGNGGTGTKVVTTERIGPVSGTLNGTAMNGVTTNYNFEMFNVYGLSCTSCGFSQQTVNDLATPKFDDNAGIAPATFTAGLGDSMDFFQYTSTGTKASSNADKTAFAFGGDADYFTLSDSGVLNYVAAVPEAETYAMMLAGLGLVGYMVRRRRVG